MAGCEAGRPVDTTFEVRKGESFTAVATELHELGVLPHPWIVRLRLKLAGREPVVRAGIYRIPAYSSAADVLDRLARGVVVTTQIAIPEGWELPQIASRVGKLTHEDADSVLALMRDSVFAASLGVEAATLEGYVYPAVYEFPLGITSRDALRIMVKRHQLVWADSLHARAAELGMTPHEIVTLASILEAEALHKDEMPRMSAVYHNRLRKGMLLQADPTVQYILPGHRRRLLYATIDSVADNPYNTYRHPGLPPGPIGAASEAAIKAALYPIESDEFFFVAGRNGRHIFTKTLAEHNRAKSAVRRAR